MNVTPSSQASITTGCLRESRMGGHMATEKPSTARFSKAGGSLQDRSMAELPMW